MEMLPPDQQLQPADGPRMDTGVLKTLDRYVHFLTKILFYLAGCAYVVMLVLTLADVIGIKIFSTPVPGAIELVAFTAVIGISFGVAQTQVNRGHVAVDFLRLYLPRRVQLVLDVLVFVLCLGILAVLAYYSFKYAGTLRTTGEVSVTQRIPYYPFVYAMAVAFTIMLMVVVGDLVKSIAGAVTQWTP